MAIGLLVSLLFPPGKAATNINVVMSVATTRHDEAVSFIHFYPLHTEPLCSSVNRIRGVRPSKSFISAQIGQFFLLPVIMKEPKMYYHFICIFILLFFSYGNILDQFQCFQTCFLCGYMLLLKESQVATQIICLIGPTWGMRA